MQTPTPIRDASLRRLVHDFDALADVLHHLLERDNRPDPSPAPEETAFTTEWQMVAAAEEVHQG